MKNICVFCSSSSAVSGDYFRAARDLGRSLGENNFTLVYGGVSVGLMGELAGASTASGGTVISVIPESIRNKGITYEKADRIIFTKDLRERKAVMEEMSDAFIALPGGFGTLEEVMEILTLKQLKLQAKAVVFINTNGFYDNLLRFFDTIYSESFAKRIFQNLYSVVPDAESAIRALRDYEPVELESKWY
ncbi:MAG: TIGR00730 family Rossman fold protein [Spirochaetes bacterium]|nr:TIGR00730 family Rossman fold protein [Spirochaetota bacterium]